MSDNTIKKIFISAGLFNIAGSLIFSMFFTNPYPAKYYPAVFSDFGFIAIILWGMAYLAVSSVYMHNRALMVFAVEKMVYVVTWVYFLVNSWAELPGIYNESIMTGMMLSVYGSGDLLFGLFFARVGFKGYKAA